MNVYTTTTTWEEGKVGHMHQNCYIPLCSKQDVDRTKKRREKQAASSQKYDEVISPSPKGPSPNYRLMQVTIAE